MNTIKIPNYPTHAVKHKDNSTGDGHIVFSMAFVHDHDFYYHENGNQIRQYVGDEILDVWNLQSQAQQPKEPEKCKQCGVRVDNGHCLGDIWNCSAMQSQAQQDHIPDVGQMVQSQAQQEPFQLPRNDTVLNILARPNFGCIGIAEALRKKGHEIARSSESEQSEVIFWMLNLYLLHGDTWLEVGEEYLKSPAPEGE